MPFENPAHTPIGLNRFASRVERSYLSNDALHDDSGDFVKFGQIAVIGEKGGAKDFFVGKMSTKLESEPGELVPHYLTMFSSNNGAPKAAKTSLREQLLSRVKTNNFSMTPKLPRSKFAARNSTQTASLDANSKVLKPKLLGDLHFSLMDVDVALREKAEITYRSVVSTANAIVYFVAATMESSSDIEEQLEEIVSLRRNEDVPVVVVADQIYSTTMKKVCNAFPVLCLCETGAQPNKKMRKLSKITSSEALAKLSLRKTSSSKSLSEEEANEKMFEKVRLLLQRILQLYLKQQEKKEVDDFLFFGI